MCMLDSVPIIYFVIRTRVIDVELRTFTPPSIKGKMQLGQKSTRLAILHPKYIGSVTQLSPSNSTLQTPSTCSSRHAQVGQKSASLTS